MSERKNSLAIVISVIFAICLMIFFARNMISNVQTMEKVVECQNYCDAKNISFKGIDTTEDDTFCVCENTRLGIAFKGIDKYSIYELSVGCAE